MELSRAPGMSWARLYWIRYPEPVIPMSRCFVKHAPEEASTRRTCMRQQMQTWVEHLRGAANRADAPGVIGARTPVRT